MKRDQESIEFVAPRLVERLDDCFFYHTMSLPGFGEVKGHWDLRGRFHDYIGGVNLKGKSVIDIGTATGFLSFEAEKEGAARVVSFDIAESSQQSFLPFKDRLPFRDPDLWAEKHNAEIELWRNAYWLCHRVLGSKASVYYGSIYDLPTQLGQFDVAIIGSVLEHLSDQVTALASVARLTRETIVVVSPLVESDDRVAYFAGDAARPESDFTWWTYSTGLYGEIFKMLGFSIANVSRAEYYYHYQERFESRYTIVATRD